MLNKFTNALMALVMAFGFMATSAHDAEARGGRGIALGIAAGIIGLGIWRVHRAFPARATTRATMTTAAIYGPRECHWVGPALLRKSLGRNGLPRRPLRLRAPADLRLSRRLRRS